MDNKAQEQEHARTLSRIARQEAAEAAKMRKGGKVKKMADGGDIDPKEFENMRPEDAVKEIKRRKQAAAAYNAASKTPPAPMTPTTIPSPAVPASAPRPFAKGGSVRGWGQARGARKARII